MYSNHYSSPYAHAQYAQRSPYVSPHTSPYWSPRYTTQYTPPSPQVHRRRATEDFRYSASTQKPVYAEPATPQRHSSQRKTSEHVSGERTRSKTTTTTTKRFVVRETAGTRDEPRSSRDTKQSQQQQSGSKDKATSHRPSKSSHYVPQHDVFADYGKEDFPDAYSRKYRSTPPPPSHPHQGNTSYRTHRADHTSYYQHNHQQQPAAYQESPSAHRSTRARGYSTGTTSKPTSRPSPPKPEPKPSKTSTSKSKHSPTTSSSHKRKATDLDAAKAGIPAGYSLKHWDPSEEPILLLGSVFDANSLGKWIYDWTVAVCGARTPFTEIAGELWLLLIKLSGKVKRAEDGLKRVRRESSREILDDFCDSGERLWGRFSALLKVCEAGMLKAAKKEKSSSSSIFGGKQKVVVGKNSGREFVDCIFGRDRELPRTEKLMQSMRLWSMRFDANCEDVLRDPYA